MSARESQRLDTDLMKLPVGPSAAAHAGTSASAPQLQACAAQQAVGDAARTTPAVASGRKVRLSPPISVNVYISRSTMSVSSPMPRRNSSYARAPAAAAVVAIGCQQPRSTCSSTAKRRSARAAHRSCSNGLDLLAQWISIAHHSLCGAPRRRALRHRTSRRFHSSEHLRGFETCPSSPIEKRTLGVPRIVAESARSCR